MTVVIGTAGHIDHGKTTLLRALTGIDADRLPEERRRGMTIDVGYAHLTLADGTELDFVDVPGHDRLVGNMLVGAGEIDAAMLVVAADDGPRAQTIEHLGLLDALAIRHGLAVVSKADIAGPERAAEVVVQVERLLVGTSLAGSPVLAVSAPDGGGIDALRAALVALRDRVLASGDGASGGTAVGGAGRNAGSRLGIDRVFAVKGRGAVVTGTLRGRPLSRGATLRLVPGERSVRIREVQVHGTTVDVAEPGRTALNVAGSDAGELHRGLVLTDDPAVAASDRILVRLAAPLPDRARARVHLGTGAADASVRRSGRDALELGDGALAAIVRLAVPLAVSAGDRLVLRRTSGADRIVGALVLDAAPPRGISRRRQSAERVGRLATAVAQDDARATAAARLDLHGVLGPGDGGVGPVAVAPDVIEAVDAAVVAGVSAAVDGRPRHRCTGAASPGDDRADGRGDRRFHPCRPARGRWAVDPRRCCAQAPGIRAGRARRRPGAHRRDGSTRTRARGPRAARPVRRRACRGLPACRGPRARAQRPDRRPGTRSRVRDVGLQRDRRRCVVARLDRAAQPGRAPRCHRDEPEIRHGDPRRPRSAWDPAANPGRPRAGPPGERRHTARGRG